MSDPFKNHSFGSAGPALGALAITPSDSTDLSQAVRSITIGTNAGVIKYISSRDGQTYTTGPLPVGMHPICARRVLSTGTTATGLTGWI